MKRSTERPPTQKIVILEEKFLDRDRTRANRQGALWFDEKSKKWRWAVTVGFKFNQAGKRVQQRVTGSHKNKTDASIALAQAITDHSRGLLSPPEKITVSEYAQTWLKAIPDEGTRAAAKKELKHALDVIGDMMLRAVTPTVLKNLMIALAQKVMNGGSHKGKTMSSRTQGKVLMHLRSLFREAVIERIVYTNPCDGIKKVKAKRAEDDEETVGRVFDFGQDTRFLYVGSALENAGLCRSWPALFTAISTGLRKGELAALTWNDIDFKKNTLTVRRAIGTSTGKAVLGPPKTKSSKRTIPLPPSVKRVLETHRKNQNRERAAAGDAWVDQDAVFAREGGGFTHPNQFNRVLDAVIAWTNPETYTKRRKHVNIRVNEQVLTELEAIVRDGVALPEMRMHDLRHTYATLALRRGGWEALATVSKNLGHASTSITTNVYRHVLPSEQEENVFDLYGATLPAPRVAARAVN